MPLQVCDDIPPPATVAYFVMKFLADLSLKTLLSVDVCFSPAGVCVCDSLFVRIVLSCSSASVASCAPDGPLASPPGSCEGP